MKAAKNDLFKLENVVFGRFVKYEKLTAILWKLTTKQDGNV